MTSAEISTEFTLDEELSTFNETAFTHELASLYRVPLAYILLEVSAGSVVVSVIVSLPPASVGQGDTNGTEPGDVLNAVALSRVSQVNTSVLSVRCHRLQLPPRSAAVHARRR